MCVRPFLNLGLTYFRSCILSKHSFLNLDFTILPSYILCMHSFQYSDPFLVLHRAFHRCVRAWGWSWDVKHRHHGAFPCCLEYRRHEAFPCCVRASSTPLILSVSCAFLRSFMYFMHSFTSLGAILLKYNLAVIRCVCWCFCPFQMLLVRDVLGDSALQQVLTLPGNFDIIVSMNLTGQYLSDALAAQVKISISWLLGLLRCASTQFFKTMRCAVRFDLSGHLIWFCCTDKNLSFPVGFLRCVSVSPWRRCLNGLARLLVLQGMTP